MLKRSNKQRFRAGFEDNFQKILQYFSFKRKRCNFNPEARPMDHDTEMLANILPQKDTS